jgi:hypothetical protein
MTQPSELGGTLRDTSDAISPSWWNGPNGQRVRYAMSTPYDALLDSFTYAIYLGLAAYGTPAAVNTQGSLRWIGYDRQIVQGFQEGTASYRARLLQWLIRHSYRGKATGVLMAVRGWILPQLPYMVVIKDSPGGDSAINSGDSVTTWTSYADGADPMPAGATTVTPPTIVTSAPRNFNWDGNYPAPITVKRAFLVIYSKSGDQWIAPAGNWGAAGSTWGDTSKCWGFAGKQSAVSGIKQLVRQWKSAGTWYAWIIVVFSGDIFDSAQPADGTHNPNGTFGKWSIASGNTRIASRFAGAAYMNGWGWPGGT